MANQYKIIDEKIWERAMHCMIFRNSVEPAFCVTVESDITHFLKKLRNRDNLLRLLLSMLYADVPMT